MVKTIKDVYTDRIVSAIKDTVNTSPAVAASDAQNLSIETPMLKDIMSPKQAPTAPVVDEEVPVETIPVVSLSDVFVSEKDKARLNAVANMPVDKSQPIEAQNIGQATKKVATSRLLDNGGVAEYRQYEYGLGDENGISVSGNEEGNTYTSDINAGNAGLNISTTGELRPLDGSMGNPAFLENPRASRYAKVMPFKVNIPAYNLEVTSETTDPRKLAYQVATLIGGKPVSSYAGYTNTGYDIYESWYSSLYKGVMSAPANVGQSVGNAAIYAIGLGKTAHAQSLRRGGKFSSEEEFENRMAEINDWTERHIHGLDKKLSDARIDLTEFNTQWGKFRYGAPSVVGQVGALVALSGITGGAAAPMMTAMNVLGLSQGAEEFMGLNGAAIKLSDRMERSFLGAGISMGLNALGAQTIFGVKAAASREWMVNEVKRKWLAAGIGGLESIGANAATELADQVASDYITYNMGDDKIAERFDNRVMAAALGAIGGMFGIKTHLNAEQIQIYKEQILAGKLKADAPDFVQKLNEGVNALSSTGLLTRERAWDIIERQASPEGDKYFENAINEAIEGMIDKLPPEATQYAKSLTKQGVEQFVKDFETINRSVTNALPKELDDNTKTMIARAMTAIAPMISWYNNGRFNMPKFRVRDGSPMAYDERTNTIYINTKSSGEPIDLGLVKDKKTPLIDPVQRGILHELGHFLDYQLQRGTNFKEFMPTYFEAIAKVYGKERADAVQKAMNKKGDTFEFAKSEKKADVKEKQADSAAGRVNVKNTTENFAYAIGRLGKKVGKALGMGDSDVAQHVDAIMLMATTLRIPSIQKQLNAYQKALTELIKKNDTTLQGMAKAQGNETLAQKIQDFVAGDTNALSKEDVLALYDILKTYTGVDGAKIIDEAFEGVKPETFMQRVEREYADSIKESSTTVGQVQDAIAKRNAEAKQETKKGNDNIDENDLPNFEVNEQIAYASTRGSLEGEHLDADRYYATGEARGHKGRAMRWGYGNYLNKSPVINKENYYDSFLSDALKRPRSKLHGFPRGVPDLEMDMLVAYLETKAKPGKSVIYKKDDIIKELNQGVDEAKQNAEKSHKEFEKAYEEAKKYSKYYEFLGAFVHEPTESQMINMLSSDFYDTISESDAKKLFGVIEGYSFKEFKKAHEAAKNVYDLRMQDFRTYDQIAVEERMKREIEDCLTDESSIEILPEEKVVMPEQHAFLIPDNEYFLDAQTPIGGQTKFVKDRINKIAEEYGWWDSEFILNPSSGAYDVDVSEVNGEEFYNWLAKHIASEQGFSDKVEAYRFARDVLADSGIKGIRTLGHRDMETFNVFRGEDTRKYKQLHEDVFDVSTVLNGNKKYVSGLEKRANAKPTGKTYADDIKEVKGIIANAGKTPKWFAKLFANGDVNMGLWSIGGKKLVDHFDLIGKMVRSSNAATDYLMEFDGNLKKTMGFKNNIERDAFENQSAIKTIDIDYTIDPLTDEATSTKVSPLVVMNLYNNAKSKTGYQKVLNTFGGDVNGMEKVLNSLTPEQKKYADAMMNYIKEKWDFYKKSYEQEGIQLDDEPYWPIADAVHIALGDRKINSDYARKKDSTGMISLDVDAREVFNHYVQRMGGAKENVYATIQRMKDIFGYEKQVGDDQPTEDYMKLSDEMWQNSKKVRGMAQTNIGGDAKYDRFLSLLDDFLNKHEAQLVGTESLNVVARNLTSGLLQWKPIQFMKNLANASGYWGLADNQAQYWSDTAWAATHPIEAAKYMFEKVPYIRNRFKGQNIDEALTQQTAGTDSLLMNWAKDTKHLSPDEQKIVSNLVALTQAARRLGFTPMLSGDMSANVVGGYGLLKQYEAKYGDRAGDKLSEDIIMHQASSIQATRSLLQRQWSRDIRGELLRFASEGVQKGKSMGLAAAQAVRGERTVGSAAKEILSTMSSMILFALISAGIIDLFDNDEENDKEVYEAMTREGISALAGFSVIGNSVIAPIVSIPLTGEMSTIGTPLTNIVSSDLKKLNKGDWENLVVHGIGSTVPVVGLDNLINLTRGVGRLTDEDERVRGVGLRQVMGRTENFGLKREGLDKETIEKIEEE